MAHWLAAVGPLFSRISESHKRKAYTHIWEFPKIRGTILGIPIIRTIVFWGLYWGPLILGNYHIHKKECI